MQTHFTKSKGKNQSCDVKNEIFVCCLFRLVYLHTVERKEMRSITVIKYIWLAISQLSQLFGMNELESIFSYIVKYIRLFSLLILILVLKKKDPQISNVNEEMLKQLFLLLIHNIGVFVEGKTNLANRGKLLIFAGIDNEMPV